MVNVKCNIVVNNDVKIPVPLQNKTVQSLTQEDINKVYTTYQTNARPVERFYILNVEGTLNLEGRNICDQCRCARNAAGFNIKYFNNLPEQWSLFLSAECETLVHIDEQTFTPEKLLNFIRVASTFNGWDENFIREWSRHIPAGK
jgi:hypothetical protein